MGTEIMIDMYKNKSNDNYNHMSSSSNRTCKGICIKFIVKKPSPGSRYGSGQGRCQICDVWIDYRGAHTKDGSSAIINSMGWFCNCCNYRVRQKPRNKSYKEKLSEQQNSKIKLGMDNEDGQLEEDRNEPIKQDSGNNKKSTPIYEEIDESVKTYYELKEFLNSRMKLQANYQLVMLKELLEYGQLHKGEIAESLAYFNNKDSSDINIVKQFFNVPVYNVLLSHELITVDNDPNYPHIPYFSLNVKFMNNEKIAMIEDLSNRLIKFNLKNNIPDNEFPNADNMGNIDWDTNKKLLINYKANNSEAKS